MNNRQDLDAKLNPSPTQAEAKPSRMKLNHRPFQVPARKTEPNLTPAKDMSLRTTPAAKLNRREMQHTTAKLNNRLNPLTKTSQFTNCYSPKIINSPTYHRLGGHLTQHPKPKKYPWTKPNI